MGSQPPPAAPPRPPTTPHQPRTLEAPANALYDNKSNEKGLTDNDNNNNSSYNSNRNNINNNNNNNNNNRQTTTDNQPNGVDSKYAKSSNLVIVAVAAVVTAFALNDAFTSD